jgi:hypothetical protein
MRFLLSHTSMLSLDAVAEKVNLALLLVPKPSRPSLLMGHILMLSLDTTVEKLNRALLLAPHIP